MRLQIHIPASYGKAIKEKLQSHVQSWEDESWDPDFEATVLIDPGSFRVIDELLSTETRGRATFDVLSVAVVEDADEALT